MTLDLSSSLFRRGVEALEHLTREVKHLVASISELKAAADQLAANDSALAAEVGTLTSAVDGLVAVVGQVSGQLSPEDQANLDAAVQEVADASADLATQSGNLTTEEGKARGATPTPPPTP